MDKEQNRLWQKCCFCLPLRGGLFFLAYLNVIGEVLEIISAMFALPIDTDLSLINQVDEVIVGLNEAGPIRILPDLVDLAYGVALVYALHKNDAMVLYAYMWYSITSISMVLYIGLMIWGQIFYPLDILLKVAVIVLYQGYITFLVRNLRVQIIRKTEDSANESTMRYSPKQPTNESDVESQPLPTAPLTHAHLVSNLQDNNSL